MNYVKEKISVSEGCFQKNETSGRCVSVSDLHVTDSYTQRHLLNGDTTSWKEPVRSKHIPQAGKQIYMKAEVRVLSTNQGAMGTVTGAASYPL